MAIDPEREFKPINIALLTISDTRGPEDDTSGDILAERIRAAGHHLASRAIEKDDPIRITARLNNWIDDRSVDCIVTTGGTGLTGRDVTARWGGARGHPSPAGSWPAIPTSPALPKQR